MMERGMVLETTSTAWKAGALPLELPPLVLPSFRLPSVCRRFYSPASTLAGHTVGSHLAAMGRPTETHALLPCGDVVIL